MSKWQPARLFKYHKMAEKQIYGDYYDQETLDLAQRKVVLVRKAEAPLMVILQYKEEGCNGTQFYQINPESLRGVGTFDVDSQPMFACEHEILTD